MKIPVAVGSGAQLFVGRGISALGILGATVIVARSVGPADYGLYSAAFALAALIVGGPTTGLPLLILRRTAERVLDRRSLRRAVTCQLFLSGALIVVATTTGAAAFGGWRGFRASLAAAVALASLSMAVLGAYVQCGAGRFRRAAASDASAGILFPVLTLCALRLGLGIAGCLTAIVFAGLGAGAISWSRLPSLPASAPVALRFRDAMPFIALGTVNSGYGRVDAVILELVAGATVVGYYAAAYRLIGLFSLLGSAFGTVYFSRLSSRDSSWDDWERVRRWGSRTFATACLTIMVISIMVEPLLVRQIYGLSYFSSIAAGQILLLSVLPWSLYWPLAAALNAMHHERQCTYAIVGGLTVDILLVALLGSRFGATGAAWAWVAAETVTLTGMASYHRRAAARWRDTYPTMSRPPPERFPQVPENSPFQPNTER